MLAAAGAAAIITAGLVLLAGDDDPDRISPADSAPAVSASTPPSSSSSNTTVPATTLPESTAMLDDLAGHRWVVVERAGEAWPLAYVPYLEFESSEAAGAVEAIVRGYDGCNWLGGTGSVNGDRLEFHEMTSTAMDCGPGVGGEAPMDGGRLVIADDKTTLTLPGASGLTLVYARLDTLAPAEASTVVGPWGLDDGGLSTGLGLSGGGTALIGTCGLSWSMDDTLVVTGWPGDPYPCLGDSVDHTESRLIEMLVGGPVTARIGGGARYLYLADNQFVLRLTRIGDPGDVSTGQTNPAMTLDPPWPGETVTDRETGAVEAPGLNDFIALEQPGWAATGEEFGRLFAGTLDPENNLVVDEVGDQIIVTIENLLDDSAAAYRITVTTRLADDGLLRFVAARDSWQCAPDRGHQDFNREPCT